MDQYLIITVALIVAASFLVTIFRTKRANLPPTIFPTIPIIGHLYLVKSPLHKTFANLAKTHGPILLLRFGSRPILLVSSHSAAEECFTKNDIIFANRPRLLIGKILSSNYSTIGWSQYGNHWRNLRRIINTEILSSHRLNESHEVFVSVGRDLLRKLISKSSSPVNFTLVFHELMLNMMMRMICGDKYDFKDIEEKGEQFLEIVKGMSKVGDVANLDDHLPFLKWFGVKGLKKEMIALNKTGDEFVQLLIEPIIKKVKACSSVDDEDSNKKKSTLIEVLFKLQESEPESYRDGFIRSFIMNLLSAGTDGLASTMEWSLAHLLNHPHILKKARNEIDEIVGNQCLVDESDMNNLPYLRSIINEILRLHTPTPLLLPHESSQDCVVSGYHVPRGTMLLVNIWAIHHDPKLWTNPEKFDPERFRGKEGIKIGFKFWPFGSGRRVCPGDGMAMRMIGLTLGLMIQCFDWEKISEGMVDMDEGNGLNMSKAKPLIAKCKPRLVMQHLVSQTCLHEI